MPKSGSSHRSCGELHYQLHRPGSITFGFAVQQIAREGDEWTLRGAAPSGDIAFAVPASAGGWKASTSPTVFDTGALDCRLDI